MAWYKKLLFWTPLIFLKLKYQYMLIERFCKFSILKQKIRSHTIINIWSITSKNTVILINAKYIILSQNHRLRHSSNNQTNDLCVSLSDEHYILALQTNIYLKPINRLLDTCLFFFLLWFIVTYPHTKRIPRHFISDSYRQS